MILLFLFFCFTTSLFSQNTYTVKYFNDGVEIPSLRLENRSRSLDNGHFTVADSLPDTETLAFIDWKCDFDKAHDEPGERIFVPDEVDEVIMNAYWVMKTTIDKKGEVDPNDPERWKNTITIEADTIEHNTPIEFIMLLDLSLSMAAISDQDVDGDEVNDTKLEVAQHYLRNLITSAITPETGNRMSIITFQGTVYPAIDQYIGPNGRGHVFNPVYYEPFINQILVDINDNPVNNLGITHASLSSDQTELINIIDGLTATAYTPMTEGLLEVEKHLNDLGTPPKNILRTVVLFTDGAPTAARTTADISDIFMENTTHDAPRLVHRRILTPQYNIIPDHYLDINNNVINEVPFISNFYQNPDDIPLAHKSDGSLFPAGTSGNNYNLADIITIREIERVKTLHPDVAWLPLILEAEGTTPTKGEELLKSIASDPSDIDDHQTVFYFHQNEEFGQFIDDYNKKGATDYSHNPVFTDKIPYYLDFIPSTLVVKRDNVVMTPTPTFTIGNYEDYKGNSGTELTWDMDSLGHEVVEISYDVTLNDYFIDNEYFLDSLTTDVPNGGVRNRFDSIPVNSFTDISYNPETDTTTTVTEEAPIPWGYVPIPPFSENEYFTIMPNETITFPDTIHEFNTIDPNREFEHTIITILPAKGTLFYNGTPVTQSDVTNSTPFVDNSLFSYLPEPDESGYNYAWYEFKIADDSLNISEEPDTLFIDVLSLDYNDISTVGNARNTLTHYDPANNTADLMIGTTVSKEFDSYSDNVDLDGLTDYTFPELKTSATTYSISTSVSNISEEAYIIGWIDFNGNGIFDSHESSDTITVSTQVDLTPVNVTLTWDGMTDNNETIIAGQSVIRLRVSTDAKTSISPTGIGGIGEIEDDYITITADEVVDFSDRLDSQYYAQNTISGYNNNGTPNDFTDDTADLMIGSTVTVDNSARTDDTDYDGTLNTIPTLTVSDNTYTISMPVKNVTGNDAKITAWVDFDGDGILEDTEQSNIYTVVTQTSSTENVTLTWNNIWTTDPSAPDPQKIVSGEQTLRIRLTTDNDIFATGVGGYGEIEDYPITIDAIIDYSDAPNYTEVSNTITITNGSSDIILGSSVTDESSAIFDDTDHDDALVSTSNPTGTAPAMSIGAISYSVDIYYKTSVNAKIVAWLDIDCNQSFDEDERIIIPVNANTTSETLEWNNITNIPDKSFTYMRIRIADSNNTDIENAYTNASAGEVEDHEIIITPIADCCDITTIGLASNIITGYDRINHTADLTLGTKVSAEAIPNSPDNDNFDDGLVSTTMPNIASDATSYQIQVVVNNDIDEEAFVCAWVDFNGNGILEVGERSNVVEVDDETLNVTVTLTWGDQNQTPISVTANSATINARIRVISGDDDECEYDDDDDEDLEPGDPDPKAIGDGCIGEIEDYPVTIDQIYYDFGDTAYNMDPARHTITGFDPTLHTSDLMLGNNISHENSSRTLDNHDDGSVEGVITSKPGTIGDNPGPDFDNDTFINDGLVVLTDLDENGEDGIIEVPAFIAGSGRYSVDVNYYTNSLQTIYITAFINFNGNSTFDTNNGERIQRSFTPTQTGSGVYTLTWTSSNINNAISYRLSEANRSNTEMPMRIRISYESNDDNSFPMASPTENVANGEVEDYLIPIHITDWIGAVSDDWYDPQNWFDPDNSDGVNTVPIGDDEAVNPNGYLNRNVHIEDVTRLFQKPNTADRPFPKLRAYYNGYANQLHIYNNAKFEMESTTEYNGASLLINDHTTLHSPDPLINGSVKGRYIIDRYVSPDVKHIISSPINYALTGTKMASISANVDDGTANGADIPYLGLTYSNYSDLMYTSEVQFNRWKDFFYGADNNNSFMDSESFDAGRGYWYQNDNTGGTGTGVTMFAFEGQPYEGYNETYSIPVYTYSSDKIDFMGQNTLGNPFSSTLAITNRARNHGETVTNFINHNTNILPTDNQAVYIWNPRYTPSGAGSNKKSGPEDNQWIILANNGFAEQCDRSTCLHYVKPYQGFTIVAKPGVNNANAEFTRGMRAQYVPRNAGGTYKDFMYNGNPGGQENEYQYPGDDHPEDEPIFYKTSNTADQWIGVQLIGYNGSSEVNTIIGINEKMTNDVDPSYDVGILKRAGKNEMYTYANGSTSHFAQLALPRTSGSVKIGFDIVETSAYNFRIFETGMKEVTLLDKLNGNTVDLLTNDYSVTLTQGTHEERFELFFTPFSTLETDPNTSEEINISCIDDVLHIENYIGDYIIYNVQGQKVYSGESTEYDYSNKLNLPQAVYLIETEGKAKKIYVQKRQ